MKFKKIYSVPWILVSFIVLLIISIIALLISHNIDTQYGWWSGFLAGLSTEILGILLTLLFVDFIIRKRDENRRRKIELIALSQIREALYSHIHLLAMLVNDSGEDKWVVVNKAFDDKYFEKISSFDITKPSNYYPQVPWYDTIPMSFKRLRIHINEVTDKYIFFLKDDTLKLLNKLEFSINNSFMLKLRQQYKISKNLGVDTAHPFKEEIIDHFKQYTLILLKLVEHHNTLVPDKSRIEKIQVSSIKGSAIHF